MLYKRQTNTNTTNTNKTTTDSLLRDEAGNFFIQWLGKVYPEYGYGYLTLKVYWANDVDKHDC